VLLALQVLSLLLRPPAPEPLAADIGLPRPRAPKPVTRPAGVARLSPARALPARRADRRGSRGRRGGRHAHWAPGRPVGEDPGVVAPPAETPTPPASPPVMPGLAQPPPPPPEDGSVEFMPH
jgi:hypothetical protein